MNQMRLLLKSAKSFAYFNNYIARNFDTFKWFSRLFTIDSFISMHIFNIRFMRTTSGTVFCAGKAYLNIILLVKTPLHKNIEDECSR